MKAEGQRAAEEERRKTLVEEHKHAKAVNLKDFLLHRKFDSVRIIKIS